MLKKQIKWVSVSDTKTNSSHIQVIIQKGKNIRIGIELLCIIKLSCIY